MPNLFTVPAGLSIADITAAHLLARYTPEQLGKAVLFVPTRRSALMMRNAFQRVLAGKVAMLPRMVPLAEIEQEFLLLLGPRAFEILQDIPSAMPSAQQRYILTTQVAAFERKRMGAVTLSYALAMAEALMGLQEKCARAGVVMTQEALRALYYRDEAEHWRDALQFLGILTDNWPLIEEAYGMTIAAQREVRMLEALAQAWRDAPPEFPVIAIGSTGSQAATAKLLATIADLPQGAVILPGLDVAMEEETWQAVTPGHPLFHVKQLLDFWPVNPRDVTALGDTPPNLWLEALAPLPLIPAWKQRVAPEHAHVKLIPCRQAEEEARVISLLLREGLDNPAAQIALITPDEGLMARVATHMQRYGVALDRLNAGTLATTETGSLWTALIAAIAEPERQLHLRALLHHPSLATNAELLAGLEKGWHGLNRSRAGQLPRHEAALREHADYGGLSQFVQQLAKFSRQQHSASAWRELCEQLLASRNALSGQGADAVRECLAALDYADGFGPMAIEEFADVVAERLSAKWRDIGLHTHPRIHLLTPVEARLQHFDRVILANMQDVQWPGMLAINPWLNLAAEKALGLPGPEEAVSLMAHDVLMLGSHGEVFLTYPERDGGSPTARSRFIERLVTLLASHGIDESAITAAHYTQWAEALYASTEFAPEAPVRPLPPADQRPTRLPVTDIDKLFTDPFAIYCKHVLKLRPLDPIDATPEASDFGQLAHRAIEALAAHWNAESRPATEAELQQLASLALRELSERPNIDLFWRARLMGGLRYVNGVEAERRAVLSAVLCEEVQEATLTLPRDKQITLHGRIDRVEKGTEGLRIIDYKTGEIPTRKAILDGRALQLMAYAMLLSPSEPVNAIEYWQLPRLGDVGEMLTIATPDALPALEEKLKEALAQMLDSETPFLARPVSTSADERFGNDYDGVSRYDEWAG